MHQLLPGSLLLTLVVGTASASEATRHTGPEHAAHQAAAPADVTAPLTDGEIRKIDAVTQKITVKHGRIENLGMSPMTMVFRIKDPAFLTAVKPGDKVKMAVERVDGALTIVVLQRVP